ncbi:MULTISPECIES: hypothetical protein [Exiguobacterium]|uniref:hypothetical protein n=1 Tax=Exiguobacterium TaxID=33986 RepID=UPI001BEAE866|nr:MULTISPECIES: hypothetical protein [Exiguobacterium]MCT4777823.1 hypothetical protein [Exiguobacterium aquaticum]MCT4789887.1 hypothetical protein [Exiguobacterium mexicanum]
MKGWQFNKEESSEKFPDEMAWALFCTVEPKRMDTTLPFYYDESVFRFSNGTESFYFKISPSYHEFEVNVKDATGELLYYQLLRTVGKVEVLEDRRDHGELLIVMNEDRNRTVTTIELTVRPRFRVLVKEHYV